MRGAGVDGGGSGLCEFSEDGTEGSSRWEILGEESLMVKNEIPFLIGGEKERIHYASGM